MCLSDLSLDELRKLSDQLTSLSVSGFRLEQDGLAPRFDLTPGHKMRITLGAVVPGLSGLVEHSFPEAAPDAPGDVATDAPEPEDPPPAAEGLAGGEPIPFTEPSRTDDGGELPQVEASSEAKVESSGGAVMAAAQAPAAPVPGSASALAAKVANAWSESEDSAVIAKMVECVTGGMSKTKAIEAAARHIGRTPGATSVYFYAALSARFAAAVAEAALQQAQTETPEIPAATAAEPDQGDADAVEDIPAAVQDEPDMEPGQGAAEVAVRAAASIEGQKADRTDLTAHLLGLTDKGGWSLQRDTDLMELSIAGWPAGEIALELRMQAAAIKPRFDALTGLHDDEATGKKVRRWTREQVLDALQSLAKARAA